MSAGARGEKGFSALSVGRPKWSRPSSKEALVGSVSGNIISLYGFSLVLTPQTALLAENN